jgi:hypothetical protein
VIVKPLIAMRKSILIVFLLGLCFINCKKNALTPDGKPASDAANNIVRVDAGAVASYWLSVCSSDSDKAGTGTGTENCRFYLLKNNLTKPYEAVFTATPGQIVFIEVYSGGPSVGCSVYYKGLKVATPQEDLFNSNDSIAPSHVNITYTVGQ